MGYSVYRTLELVRQCFQKEPDSSCFRVWSREVKKISNPIIRSQLELSPEEFLRGDTWIYYRIWDGIVKAANAKRCPKGVLEIYEGYQNYRSIAGPYALDFPYIIKTVNRYNMIDDWIEFFSVWKDFSRGKDFFFIGKFDIASIVAKLAISGKSGINSREPVQLTLFGNLGGYFKFKPADILRVAFPECLLDSIILYSSRPKANRRFYHQYHIGLRDTASRPGEPLRGTTFSRDRFYTMYDRSLCIEYTDIIKYIQRYSSWWQLNRGKIDELHGWISLICRSAFYDCPQYKRYQERAAAAGIMPQDFNLFEIPPGALEKRSQKIRAIINEAQEGRKKEVMAETLKQNKAAARVHKWIREIILEQNGSIDTFPVKDEAVFETDGLSLSPIKTSQELEAVAKELKNCAHSARRCGKMMVDSSRLIVCRDKDGKALGLAEISRSTKKDSKEIMVIETRRSEGLVHKGVSLKTIEPIIVNAIKDELYVCGIYRDQWERIVKLGEAAFKHALLTAIYNNGCIEFNSYFDQASGIANSRLFDNIKDAFELYRKTYLVNTKPLVSKPAPLRRKAAVKPSQPETPITPTEAPAEAPAAAVEVPVAA